MRLEGKRIILTGSSGGLGQRVESDLLLAGAELATLGRSNTASSSAQRITADLSTIDGIAAAAGHVAAFAPDILINLAGVQYFGPFETQTPGDIETTYLVDLIAPVMLTKAALPGMKSRGGGQIVNIGSIFGSISYAHFVTYSSAKAGLRAFSEALRRELHDTQIAVTYIAPRAVKTGLSRGRVLEFARLTKMGMDQPDAISRAIVNAIIARRKDVYLGFPESLFVRLNAVLPRVVDAALVGNDRKARFLFDQR